MFLNTFKLENKVYFGVWIYAVLLSIYRFSCSSSNYFNSYKDLYDDFTDGWSFISKKRDKGDFEWETFNYFIFSILPWISIFIVSSEIIKKLKLKVEVIQSWQICFTVTLILFKFGLFPLCFILFQPITFIFCNSISKNKLFQWVYTLFCIALISFYKQISTSEDFLQYFMLSEYKSYIIILTLCWTNLRCISFNLDHTEFKLTINYVLNFLAYCLYAPTIFCGPFILWQDFKHNYQTGDFLPLQQRAWVLAQNVTRCLFWLYFANFALHYIYVNATGFQPELIETFDAWSIYGYGYTMGQFFHIKYLVLYGLSTALAKFDNVRVPFLPRCIGRVHLYSDMWKYFDPGLHSFLIRFIYVPTMKSQVFNSKVFSGFLCFAFVFFWHGIEDYILIWAILNFLGVTLESMCGKFYKERLQGTGFLSTFSPLWIGRITCVLASPLLAMTAISNFYFFAGVKIGNIFVQKLLNDNILTNAVLLGALYCCCQVSTELRTKNANKM